MDSYLDLVRSDATLGFTDLGLSLPRSRGQYLTGSWYLHGGAFLEGELSLPHRVVVRAGSRASWAVAHAPGDSESGSAPVDRSFRAPNLDDLTSRQQTGPGFQFENPLLAPEKATSLEAGLKLRTSLLSLQLWAFHTWLEDAMGRQPREARDCPPETPQCQASWSRFQLVNAREVSVLHGLEASARVRLVPGLVLSANASWAWGEGPHLGDPPSDPSISFERRVPLSRVPPLNGNVELLWTHPSGLGAGGALRWASAQTRLAVADRSDARIPLGGTPGFAVVDARVSYRWREALLLALVAENLLDTPYRYHGSSVNGPGRGVILSLEGGLP